MGPVSTEGARGKAAGRHGCSGEVEMHGAGGDGREGGRPPPEDLQ